MEDTNFKTLISMTKTIRQESCNTLTLEQAARRSINLLLSNNDLSKLMRVYSATKDDLVKEIVNQINKQGK